TAPVPLANTDGFELAYGVSLVLDRCGQGRLANIYRRALLDKFDQCPFTPEAKTKFYSWVKEAKEHGKLSDTFGGGSCKRLLETEESREVKTLLERYNRGEVKAGTIFGESCNSDLRGF
ncbi:hypothetical protein, partial [Leclercia adecarboxylata]|uniref:hypothetical protein n=2 Tax=Leclercia adecarboxylata TaxID=83655 RepID=UPI00234CB3F8